MQKHARTLLIMLTSFTTLMISCEKEVHINLKSSDPQVVVQGQIETGAPPYVILTSTIGFFSKVDLSTYEKSFIHDAVVTVSDGTKTVTLKEYTFDTGASFRFSLYTLDTTNFNPANFLFGENNKTYTLSITHGGRTYTGVTKIPTPQGIDSMWFDEPLFAGNKTPDSALQLFVNYKDPDTPGDNVRYFTQRGNDIFYPSEIFNDEVVNGKQVNKIGLVAGYEETSDKADRNRDSLIYFFPGESVTLKWCAVDKGVYTFFNTLQFARNSVGNPFASPINPTTNMRNGALGVWAGYGVYERTAVVPHK
ncbi:MAG: DUF4249 domain-containing protein [Taibaiella sp.]|nr:DUF4249 domain-containing protein [Taibaiella sp.]